MAEAPLDEIQWRSPPIAQQMGGIHTNTVLPYFSSSPFFDQTSNNATLTNQAMYNQNMFHFIQTREAFEGRLRSMAGLEFMVTHDPSDSGKQHFNSGVWVIRKQVRRKRPGQEDEITPYNSYFVVGENIYMAPSVGNILASRMLTTSNALKSMMDSLSKLGTFMPSLGRVYQPPAPKSITSSAVSSFQTAQTSRESTIAPDAQSQVGSTRAKTSFGSSSSTDLLYGSLTLALNFADEYMDETPTMGEPGSFVIQKPKGEKITIKPVASTATSKAPTPLPPIQTDLPDDLVKKALRGSEKSPLTPGAAKRRKKTKTPVSATGPTKVPEAVPAAVKTVQA